MPTSTPAAPTKLILCQPLGDGRRLLIEIATDDAVTATPWDGARQVGKPVTIALAKAPRMRVLVETVRRALAQQPITSPYPARCAQTPSPVPAPAH